jgi:hypothetical protein
MISPPEEDAVPEVLEQRRREFAAMENHLESSSFLAETMALQDPPEDLALVMGAMRGDVVHLHADGEEVPVWLGMLAAASTAVDRVETEWVASACLDALAMGPAEALAHRLAGRGFTVLAAPLPAIGGHREPLKRRRAVHRDPAMQAKQALYKARHGLDALIEQATIYAGDRPVLIRSSLWAVSDLVAMRQNLDRVPVIACTEEGDAPMAFPPGMYMPGPQQRSGVFGSGPIVMWFFRHADGSSIGRLQMPRVWWDTHGSNGANRVTGWLLSLKARSGAGLYTELGQRLEEVLESSSASSACKDL